MTGFDIVPDNLSPLLISATVLQLTTQLLMDRLLPAVISPSEALLRCARTLETSGKGAVTLKPFPHGRAAAGEVDFAYPVCEDRLRRISSGFSLAQPDDEF